MQNESKGKWRTSYYFSWVFIYHKTPGKRSRGSLKIGALVYFYLVVNVRIKINPCPTVCNMNLFCRNARMRSAYIYMQSDLALFRCSIIISINEIPSNAFQAFGICLCYRNQSRYSMISF